MLKPRIPYIISLVALVMGCNGQPTKKIASDSVPAKVTAQPHRVQHVTLTLLDYQDVQELIASYRGNVVVMDVWSTACPPCVEEFPEFVALHNTFHTQGVRCISLSLDYYGGRRNAESHVDPVLTFLRRQGATFDNVLAIEPADEMLEKLRLGGPPAIYVYDRQGRLARRFDNETVGKEPFTFNDIRQLVTQLLAEKPDIPSKEWCAT